MSGVVTGDQQAQNISLTGMYSQLGINFAIGVGTLFVFGFLRPRNGIVYAPKQTYVNEKKQPPKLENGLFSWIKPVLNTPESLLIEKIGLDSVMFIRFITMCRNLFFWLFILGCVIIVPVNVYGTLQDRGSLPSTDNPLAILSISFLKKSKWFWTHIVLTWVFSFILYKFLYTQYKEYSKFKLDYFNSEEYRKSLHSRTLLVMGIPQSMKTDEELKSFVDSLRLKYPITEAHISRKVGNLTELLKDHDETYFHSTLDPDNIPSKRPTHRSSLCNGAEIDSIDHYTEKIQSLERQIKDARETCYKTKLQNYGFISFANISHAHAAAKKLEKISAKKLMSPTFILAPWPKDIIWKNLSNVGAVKGTKRFLSYSLFLALCFFWLVPVSFISTAAKISNIVRLAPVTAKIFYANQFITGLLEAWMSPLILAIFFLMLPSILRYLSRFQGKITKSSLDRSTLAKLYLFFILNSIIIYTASSTALDIFSKIKAILNQKDSNFKDIYSVFQNTDIFEQIADSMISVSTFWINYISLRGVGVIFDLAQIASLLIKFVKGLYVTQTPRNIMEYSRPPDFDYAVYYNIHLFFFTIGILYCVIAPVILLFCAAYFALAYLIYRYQLMYVFTTKVETGGTYWRVVFNRLIVSILFWQCVMIGVMNLKGAHIQSIAVLPLPVITIFLKIMCSRSFDEKIRYGIIDNSSEEEKNEFIDGRDQVSNRFLHPSLTTELIAPMVPAGAKRAQIPLDIKNNYLGDGSPSYQNYQPSTPSPSSSQITLNQSSNTREYSYSQQPISPQQYSPQQYSPQQYDSRPIPRAKFIRNSQSNTCLQHLSKSSTGSSCFSLSSISCPVDRFGEIPDSVKWNLIPVDPSQNSTNTTEIFIKSFDNQFCVSSSSGICSCDNDDVNQKWKYNGENLISTQNVEECLNNNFVLTNCQVNDDAVNIYTKTLFLGNFSQLSVAQFDEIEKDSIIIVKIKPGIIIYEQPTYFGESNFLEMGINYFNSSEQIIGSIMVPNEIRGVTWLTENFLGNNLGLFEPIPNFSGVNLTSKQISANDLSISSSTCQDECGSGGYCSGNNTCTCKSGFTGSRCEQCIPGFWGPTCEACSTTCGSPIQFTCDDGVSGTGKCKCTKGFMGASCNICAPGFYGENCQACDCGTGGICDLQGTCSCISGWDFDNTNKCNACKKGYYLSDNDCKACSPGCSECSSDGTCTSCRDGLQLSPDGKNCTPTSSPLTPCLATQFFDGNVCVNCDPSCGSCYAGTPSNCLTCASPNLYLEGSCVTPVGGKCTIPSSPSQVFFADNTKGICQACPSSCTDCTFDSNAALVKCSKCMPGYVLDNEQCVKSCPAGKVINSDDKATCIACSPNCATCDGPLINQCLSCSDPSQFSLNGSCSAEPCPSSYVTQNNTCVKCHPDCLECSGPGMDQCTKCPLNRPILTEKGQCVESCPIGKFEDSTTGKCQACDSSCSSCFGSKSDQCLGCSDISKFLQNGSCDNECPSGTIIRRRAKTDNFKEQFDEVAVAKQMNNLMNSPSSTNSSARSSINAAAAATKFKRILPSTPTSPSPLSQVLSTTKELNRDTLTPPPAYHNEEGSYWDQYKTRKATYSGRDYLKWKSGKKFEDHLKVEGSKEGEVDILIQTGHRSSLRRSNSNLRRSALDFGFENQDRYSSASNNTNGAGVGGRNSGYDTILGAYASSSNGDATSMNAYGRNSKVSVISNVSSLQRSNTVPIKRDETWGSNWI
ncbi:4639_t:CDS:10 [Diversispora eburnea]|uniref:4639_t:CDS:1 n=1 Tax=Diversispora eburnea TaxID=1213867 RepID=A0A9N8Z9Z8_9GLOM|nr:4639_t:CDS:10 [Diversispora eburnea]